MPPYLHQLGENLVDKATGLIPKFRSTRWKTSRVMRWCRILGYCQICARNKWGKHEETLTVNVGTLPFSVCCALFDVLFDRYTDLSNVAFYLTCNLAYILMFFQHSTWHSYMTYIYIFWHSSIFFQIYFYMLSCILFDFVPGILPDIASWIVYLAYTSSTAQGGGGSFKNRKPIGEVDGCESGMAERSH